MMDDLIPGENEFEIEEPEFECIICEELVEFEFDESTSESSEMPEDMDEKMMEAEMDPEFDLEPEDDIGPGMEETEMRVECICGARYKVRKEPGVPGFIVKHISEEDEFMDEMTDEENIF